MRPLVSLLAVVSLGSSVLACGGAKSASRAAGGTVETARTREVRPTIVFGVAHGVRGLMGDFDDDETESKSTDVEPGGDEDNDNDNDKADNAGKGYYDKDDGPISTFGHTANSRDTHMLTTIVKRYFHAAATDDGATACSLTYPTLANAIPEDYGQAQGPIYLRGAKTCAAIMSRLFEHERQRLKAELGVTDVRMVGNRAVVLLGSATVPAAVMALRRSHGVWGVDELLDYPLP